MARSSVRVRPRRSAAAAAGDFYRIARMLHGYLSAFAFLALLFFAVTGLTLNHPEWLARPQPAEHTVTVQVPRLEIAQAMRDPATAPRVLVASVAEVTPVVGAYASGTIADGQALIRLAGPGGASDITLTLVTGEAQVTTRRTTLVGMLDDLHRGKAAGAPWRLLIDVSAILIIALSLLGYVLFLAVRFRLRMSLLLTAFSLLLMIGTAVLLSG